MSRFARPLLALLAITAGVAIGITLPACSRSSSKGWPASTREQKPWARWWWPGSAVDKANLTHELEAIAAAGFGGVEITPIYGAKGYESRYVSFLSPDYVAMLAHVGAEAKRLGLGVDMATGTGWPFGGPSVAPQDVELKLDLRDGKLNAVPSKFRVKRAAPGGEGFVMNPYSPEAMTRYLEPFTKALGQLPAGTLRGQFHDSFEYTANWATNVPEKFRALHGYDLADHVKELSGEGDPDSVARIKADYRTTLAALHLEYVQTWVKWSHDHGYIAREQAHGSPGNLLDLYGAADIPETEIFGSRLFPIPGFRREPSEIGRDGHPPLVHKFASSAAHIAGRPLASSETFTWLREHFHESPSEMKPELDELFLAGINHVFFHGTCYSPADAAWPGWVFYASTQANPRNPLWRDLGDGLNQYIARCQSLLQAGEPDNDVLVYWPVDDLWHTADGLQRQLTVHAQDWLLPTPFGQTAQALADLGVQFDYISDAQLAATTVTNGRLKPAGDPRGRYTRLVVPKTTHLNERTFAQLVALAQDGATIVFVDDLPADVPGYGHLEERRETLRKAKADLSFSATDAKDQRIATIGAGRFVVCPAAALTAHCADAAEPLAQTGLRILRRRMPAGPLYFIVNLTGKPFDGWATLRVSAAKSVEILDPLTGVYGEGALRRVNGMTSAYLQLQPGESLFIQFHEDNVGRQPAWQYTQTTEATVPLNGEWHVSFISGGPTLPAARSMTKLHSWANDADEAAQNFGGTARYEIEFEVPAEAKADDWLLDLGDVRETARILVNGKPADLLWSLPFRAKIGALVHPGKNQLAIEVTNLAANRIRDLDRRHVPWKNFHEINFVNIHYEPFDASHWPLQPSGLLGPVTLRAQRGFAP